MSEKLAVWSTLFLLGGLSRYQPGTGWLFAVARGMQEHRARSRYVAAAYRCRPRAVHRRGGSHRETGAGGGAADEHPDRRGGGAGGAGGVKVTKLEKELRRLR